MVDPRTQAYLRELSNKQQQAQQQEPCDCKYCTEERKKGNRGVPLPSFSTMSAVAAASEDPYTKALRELAEEAKQKNKRMFGHCDDPKPTIFDKVLGIERSNFIPEASSNPDLWDYSKRHKRS